jgi:hypothetical protein
MDGRHVHDLAGRIAAVIDVQAGGTSRVVDQDIALDAGQSAAQRPTVTADVNGLLPRAAVNLKGAVGTLDVDRVGSNAATATTAEPAGNTGRAGDVEVVAA